MKIGSDIDGVVSDLGKMILPYIRQVCPDATIEDFTDYNFVKFGFTSKQMQKLFKSFEHSGDYTLAKPIQGSIWGTHELTNNGHEIYFLTARDQYPSIETETFQWLTRNNYAFRTLIHSKDKYYYCRELGLDLLIEDNPEEIQDNAAMGLNMICYDQPWNRKVKETNKIKRVKSWFEIARIFKK